MLLAPMIAVFFNYEEQEELGLCDSCVLWMIVLMEKVLLNILFLLFSTLMVKASDSIEVILKWNLTLQEIPPGSYGPTSLTTTAEERMKGYLERPNDESDFNDHLAEAIEKWEMTSGLKVQKDVIRKLTVHFDSIIESSNTGDSALLRCHISEQISSEEQYFYVYLYFTALVKTYDSENQKIRMRTASRLIEEIKNLRQKLNQPYQYQVNLDPNLDIDDQLKKENEKNLKARNQMLLKQQNLNLARILTNDDKLPYLSFEIKPVEIQQ